jgi:molybdopterin converting factor small subunit
MKITILFFASARELVGLSKKSYEFSEKPTIKIIELREFLQNEFPQLRFEKDQIKLAVNKVYWNTQDIDFEIKDGDEVALIPPIAGG